MDDFEFDFQPGINKKELLELNRMGFLDKKENILFVGSSGVGKTHLATAIGITNTAQKSTDGKQTRVTFKVLCQI